MKELKWKTIVATFAIVLVVLLAGWFTYQQFMLKQPLQKNISEVPNVTLVNQPAVAEEDVIVKVDVNDTSTFKEAITKVTKIAEEYYSNKNVIVELEENNNDQLNNIWSTQLFNIAEIMSNKSYSKIPALMDQLTTQYKNLQVTYDIDDTYVYITLGMDDHTKYILLPLEAQKMEGWVHA